MPYRSIACWVAACFALALWLSPVLSRLGGPPASLRVRQAPAASEARPAVAERPGVSTTRLDDVARVLGRAIDAERRRASLGDLESEPHLAEIAVAHSERMLHEGFFGDLDPDGEGPQERVARQHRRLIGGSSDECLWRGSGFASDDPPSLAAEIVRSWMGNGADREKLLGSRWTHFGVGVAQAGEEIRATVMLAEVVAYLDEPLPPTMASGAPSSWEVRTLASSAPVAFDLFADGRPWSRPRPLDGSTLDAEPGTYRLRFYFQSGQGRRIANGPRFEVMP